MAGGLVTRNITILSQGANGAQISSQYSVTGNAEANFSQTVPIGTNTHYTFAFPHSTLQSFDVVSSVNMTLDFNSSGSPAPQMVLLAGIPFHWDVAENAINATNSPNPFSADITGIYCTSLAAGSLNLSALLSE